MSKIFIDPGHGAHDPGAVGKHSKEKDNVLKVGLRLKTLLESAGHTVKMSRSTDVFVSLSERARMANAWGADYFVSLHNNSATATATGFETFVFNGAVSSITLAFQKAIHEAIAPNIGIRDRGRKRANYAVIRETKMPAVLIEYAFISHKDDEQILINKVEQMAQWTANGIVAYAGGKVDQASKPVSKPQPAKPKPSPTKPTKTPTSLVDYLKGQKIDSSFSNRKKLAAQYGIKNYSGTAAQNTELLDKMMSGSVASKPSAINVKTGSVVDWLKANKMDSSFASRAKLAKEHGIKNYKGTAAQNSELLSKLRR